MAFGNVITDGTQVAVGTNGYVVTFDLSGQEVDTITQVQLQASGTTLSTPSISAVAKETLYAYPEATSPPTFAWCQEGQIAHVFCKTATYPYSSATRIAFWFYRNPEDCTAVGSTVDIPQEAKALADNLILQSIYEAKGKTVPASIRSAVQTQKNLLGL